MTPDAPPRLPLSVARKTWKVAATWYDHPEPHKAVWAYVQVDPRQPIWRGSLKAAGITRRQFQRAYLKAYAHTRTTTVSQGGALSVWSAGELRARVDAQGEPDTARFPLEGILARGPRADRDADGSAHRRFQATLRDALQTLLFRNVNISEGIELGTIARATLSRRWRSQRNYARQQVEARLDPAALAAFRHVMAPRAPNLLAWLFNAPADRRARRIQALRAFPALIFHELVCSRDTNQLLRAIDDAQPLVPALAACFGTSAGHIRRWEKVTLQRAVKSLANLNLIPKQIQAMAHLPPHLMPRTQADFMALRRLIFVIDHSIPRDWAAIPCLLRGAGPSLAQAIPFAPHELHGIADMMRSLRRHLGTGGLNDAASAVGNKSLRRLVALSQRWHAGVARISILGRSHGVKSWPGVMREAFLHASEHVLELTDSDALVEEGQAQHHCVGTYAHVCLSGRARILAVRGPDGRRLSTAQVALAPDARSLRVVQHYGQSNTAPPREAKAAISAWLRYANSHPDAVDLRWPEIERAPSLHGEPFEQAVREFWRKEHDLPRWAKQRLRHDPLPAAHAPPARRALPAQVADEHFEIMF